MDKGQQRLREVDHDGMVKTRYCGLQVFSLEIMHSAIIRTMSQAIPHAYLALRMYPIHSQSEGVLTSQPSMFEYCFPIIYSVAELHLFGSCAFTRDKSSSTRIRNCYPEYHRNEIALYRTVSVSRYNTCYFMFVSNTGA
jgi:hypothetical protein